MLVEVNTDNHIAGREALTTEVRNVVEATLDRFSNHITRVIVQLHDANGPKHGSDDKTCLMEARPAGHQSVVASHKAETLGEAVNGAAEKLVHALDHIFGRLEHKKGRTSMGGDQVI